FTLSMLASGGGSPFGTGEAVTCTPGTVATMEEPCSVLWYEFNISESSNVRLEATSSDFDTQMYLFDANSMTSSYLAFDDDGGDGTLSRIESVLNPGHYVLAVGEKQLSAAEALAGINSGSGL